VKTLNCFSYLIRKSSKFDLVYKDHKWNLPVTTPFRSLRLAKTYIKSHIGVMNVTQTIQLPGQIRSIEIKGVFEL